MFQSVIINVFVPIGNEVSPLDIVSGINNEQQAIDR